MTIKFIAEILDHKWKKQRLTSHITKMIMTGISSPYNSYYSYSYDIRGYLVSNPD